MIVKPFVLAFIATAGFAILFNIERKKAVVASFGGSLAWVVYETLNTLTGVTCYPCLPPALPSAYIQRSWPGK